MTFFSPVSKGQWKVIGGTVKTQVDVKQTQRFPQVLGEKRSLEQVLSGRAPGSCRTPNNLVFPYFRKEWLISLAHVHAG